MKFRGFTTVWTLALAAVSLAATPNAFSQCGLMTKAVKPSAWEPQLSTPHLLLTGDEESARSEGAIVGMWHVVFTATKNEGATIPSTVIDNALAVWHSDHTEIMNSVRPPQDGNFCLGVWESLGHHQYYLNHFPWYSNEFPNNNSSGIGEAVGPTQIQEWVTVGPDGCHFTGTFKLTAYDLNNKVLVAFTGTLAGTRVTVKTTEEELVN